MGDEEEASPEKKRKRLTKGTSEGKKSGDKDSKKKKATPMADFFAKKPAGKQPAKAKGITSFFKPKEKVEKSKVAQTPPPNDNKENDADEAMDEEEEAEKGEDEEEVEVEEAEESEEAEKDDEAQKEEEEEEDEEVVEKAAEEVKEKVKKEEEVPKVPVSSFFQPRAKVAEKPPSKPTPKSAASPAKAKPKAKEEKIEEKDEEAQVEDKEEDSNEEDVVEEEEEDEEEDDDDSGDEESAKTKKPKAKKVDKQASKTEGESEEEAGTWKPGQYGAATWKAGKDVPYLALAEMFAQVEAEGSRLLNTKYLANCFRSIISTTPSNLLPAVYLTMASVAPAYEGVELGIGDFILVKALAESCGGKVQMIKDKLKEEGDIGEVAEQVRAKQKTMFPPPPLTIVGVYKTLRQIADIKGSKSGAQKSNLIKKLLVSCRGREARFISRCLQGNLRIGLAGAGVLAGLGQAVALTPPGKDVLDTRKTLGKAKAEKLIEDCSELIKQAYTEVPNFDLVIKALLEHGCEALPTQCFLTPGIPIKVMLGKPAKGIKEVLAKFADAMFTIEFKYDGERAQIHMLENGTVQIYSRNSENNTSKYPDLCALMPTICDKETTSFIIDCEVVAWDPKEKKILPFQQLSTRKRKDAQVDDVTVQVCLFAFDLIYRNNKSFLNESFAVRRKELVDHFKVVEGKFQFAEHKNTDSFEDIEEFMALAIKSSCEGLMVKALDLEAGYVPNKRNWLKVKKDYLDGCGDSLDLVPIAAFYGKGKRTGVYGAFLMACYDAETEEYQSICKLGTGLSDEDLKTTTAFFKEHLLEGPRPYYSYPETMKPDVWFDTKQVWEVLCADLSLSPVHKAAVGQVHESKGIALRFPRFIRLRPDKTCELATSAEQVVEFYQNQSVIGGGGDGGGGEDD